MDEAKDEDNSNPWIEVPKRKKRSFTDTSRSPELQPTITNFHPNSFDNLSLKDTWNSGGENAFGGDDAPHSPETVADLLPPQKRKRKDGKKVQSFFSLYNEKLKSHYPTIEVDDKFVNKKVSLTVVPSWLYVKI